MIFRRFFDLAPAGAGLQTWRERILSVFMSFLLIFGSAAYILTMIPLIEDENWAQVGFYTMAYVWVLGINIIKRTSYTVKALSIVVIGYLITLLTLSEFGLSGDGRIWMLFFVVFSSLLLGLRAGLIATVVSAITFIVVGYLMTQGLMYVPPIEELANTLDSTTWINQGVVLIWLTLTMVVSSAVIQRGLENSLKKLQKTLSSEKSLSEELGEESERFSSRSEDLERRLNQIRAAAEVSRVISAVLTPQKLMQDVVDLMKERFELYYVGVFLIDDRGQYAVLSSGTGDEGEQMIANAHKLSVGGTSMVGWATAHHRPRIALDVGQEAIRFNNPYLPQTRSELALPLLRGEEILGAISVQSNEAEAFDEDDITVLQGIADSLATALENARLFQEIEKSLQEISQFNRQYIGSAWSEVRDGDAPLNYMVEGKTKPKKDERLTSISVPLTLRDQQVIGNISLESEKQNWTESEMDFIEAVSNQAAIALENARLLEESQNLAERERTLNEMTNKFAQSLDFDTLLQNVVKELGQLPKVMEASIHLTNPLDTGTLTMGNTDAKEKE